MRKSTKREFVAALRSGEYEQGIGQLARDVDGRCQFCALGVLIDACHDADWNPSVAFKYTWFMDGLSASLSLDVRKALGIKHEEVSKIISWNDTKRLTFEQIADKVEAEL